MKFSIESKSLLRTLTACGYAADTKSTMPILACVHLRAEGNSLTLSGTDLYTTVQVRLDAKVEAPGAVCIPHKALTRALKSCKSCLEFGFEVKNDVTVEVSMEGAKSTLHGFPGEEFPVFLQPTGKAFTMQSDALADVISRCFAAVSIDETRASFNSMHFEFADRKLTAGSTDGHRLTRTVVNGGGFPSCSMLVSRSAIDVLRRILPKKAELRLTTENTLFVEFGDVRFSTKLVDATFPPFNGVIPQTVKHTAVVQADALVSAIKAVAHTMSDKESGAKFCFETDVLTLITENTETGQSTATTPVKFDGKEAFTIGINLRYVLDAIESLGEPTITIGVTDVLDPILFTGSGSTISLVMPMRI